MPEEEYERSHRENSKRRTVGLVIYIKSLNYVAI